MLALWDEEKVRDPPIELSDLLESGGVLVSQEVVKPVGLRDLTELEKKVSLKFPSWHRHPAD